MLPTADVTFDQPIAQADRAARMTRDIGFVRNENNCVSALIEVFEGVMISSPVFESRLPVRFVGQDDGGIVDQGPRDRDPLALTAEITR